MWGVGRFLIHQNTKSIKTKLSVPSCGCVSAHEALQLVHTVRAYSKTPSIQVQSRGRGLMLNLWRTAVTQWVCLSGVCSSQVLLCFICFRFGFMCASFQKVHQWSVRAQSVCVCVCVCVHSPQPSDLTLSSVDWRLFLAVPHDSRALLFLKAACWLAHSVTPLPGHEGLQHSHALFGEVVLSNNVLQGVEVTGNHQYRLYLVLTLEKSEQH